MDQYMCLCISYVEYILTL